MLEAIRVYLDSSRETWTDVQLTDNITSADVISICISQSNNLPDYHDGKFYLSELCMGYDRKREPRKSPLEQLSTNQLNDILDKKLQQLQQLQKQLTEQQEQLAQLKQRQMDQALQSSFDMDNEVAERETRLAEKRERLNALRITKTRALAQSSINANLFIELQAMKELFGLTERNLTLATEKADTLTKRLEKAKQSVTVAETKRSIGNALDIENAKLEKNIAHLSKIVAERDGQTARKKEELARRFQDILSLDAKLRELNARHSTANATQSYDANGNDKIQGFKDGTATFSKKGVDAAGQNESKRNEGQSTVNIPGETALRGVTAANDSDCNGNIREIVSDRVSGAKLKTREEFDAPDMTVVSSQLAQNLIKISAPDSPPEISATSFSNKDKSISHVFSGRPSQGLESSSVGRKNPVNVSNSSAGQKSSLFSLVTARIQAVRADLPGNNKSLSATDKSTSDEVVVSAENTDSSPCKAVHKMTESSSTKPITTVEKHISISKSPMSITSSRPVSRNIDMPVIGTKNSPVVLPIKTVADTIIIEPVATTTTTAAVDPGRSAIVTGVLDDINVNIKLMSEESAPKLSDIQTVEKPDCRNARAAFFSTEKQPSNSAVSSDVSPKLKSLRPYSAPTSGDIAGKLASGIPVLKDVSVRTRQDALSSANITKVSSDLVLSAPATTAALAESPRPVLKIEKRSLSTPPASSLRQPSVNVSISTDSSSQSAVVKSPTQVTSSKGGGIAKALPSTTDNISTTVPSVGDQITTIASSVSSLSKTIPSESAVSKHSSHQMMSHFAPRPYGSQFGGAAKSAVPVRGQSDLKKLSTVSDSSQTQREPSFSSSAIVKPSWVKGTDSDSLELEALNSSKPQPTGNIKQKLVPENDLTDQSRESMVVSRTLEKSAFCDDQSTDAKLSKTGSLAALSTAMISSNASISGESLKSADNAISQPLDIKQPRYRYAPKSVIAEMYLRKLGSSGGAGTTSLAIERHRERLQQLYGTFGLQTEQGLSSSDRQYTGTLQPDDGGSNQCSGVAAEVRSAQDSDTSYSPAVSETSGQYHVDMSFDIFDDTGSPACEDNDSMDTTDHSIRYRPVIPRPVRRRMSAGEADVDDSLKLSPIRRAAPVADVVRTTIHSPPAPRSDEFTDHHSKGGIQEDEEERPPTWENVTPTIVCSGNFKKPKASEPHVSSRRVRFEPLALLLDAALEGELEVVKKTAALVRDVNASNDEGITALHNAICAGHLSIVRFLVEYGCDVNAPDSDGWTPIHCAASCNNLPMLELLMAHGACIFATTISDQELASNKCDEDEEGYEACSLFLHDMEEKLGTINSGAVYASFDFDASALDELSFRNRDCLMVKRRGDENEEEWWWASLGDKEGYIPRNLLALHPRVVPRWLEKAETGKNE